MPTSSNKLRYQGVRFCLIVNVGRWDDIASPGLRLAPTPVAPTPSVEESELPARSTSIAALRNEMLKELKRLRELLKTE